MDRFDKQIIPEGHAVAEIVSNYSAARDWVFEQPEDVSPREDQNTGGSEKFLEGPGLTIYHYYPFLFSDEFPQLATQDVRQIAVAGYLYTQSLLKQDWLIDRHIGEHDPIRSQTFLEAAFMHEESLTILHSLFVPASPFWRYLGEYHREFARAVFLESAKHVERISHYVF